MKWSKALVPGAFALLLAASPATAQTLQDEIIGDLRVMQEKIAGLAEAVPVASYTHRVHPDVRSIGEELMHVASANFRFPAMLGVDEPDVAPGWFAGDALGVAKASAVTAVNASFEFMI